MQTTAAHTQHKRSKALFAAHAILSRICLHMNIHASSFDPQFPSLERRVPDLAHKGRSNTLKLEHNFTLN
jgi:hypothetical protein